MQQNKHRGIYETLKRAILDGKYEEGRPLPSAPALMKKFGVARATAVAALKALEREGLAKSRRGSGTYPVKREPTAFGVIVPEAHIPFYTSVCEGIANFANNSGGGGGIIRCYGAHRRVAARAGYARLRGCAWNRMSRACFSRPRATDG